MILHFNLKSILENNGVNNNLDYKNKYENLYLAVKKAILNGTLKPETRLPPSRVLAVDLNISRSTVLKAFDLLILENYIKSIKGSGYYVLMFNNSENPLNRSSNTLTGKYPSISNIGNAFKKNIHLINSSYGKSIAFRPGLPPLDIFPINKWKNILNDYWSTVRPSELSYSESIGLECLRENIADYLKIYRNIDCNSNQIVITSGSLHSLFLLANVLIDKNDEVVMENPTYPNAYSLFKSFKANIKHTSIDDEGLVIKNILCESPKFIYTTPSNQYPLGVKMSLNRRNELLAWASLKNTFIIEDDYNHEISNWEQPISSIYSLDNQERVIYLGTFNKLLHPSIRLGYMIVPNYLLDAISAFYAQSSRFISPALQKAMSVFIEKDYLNKHLRNVIQISKERKSVFINEFNRLFENDMNLIDNNTGLHLIANFVKKMSDIQLSQHLSKDNITAHPLSKYYIDDTNKNGLVLGYSSVSTKSIKDNLEKMKRNIDQFKKA